MKIELFKGILFFIYCKKSQKIGKEHKSEEENYQRVVILYLKLETKSSTQAFKKGKNKLKKLSVRQNYIITAQ